MAAQAVADRTCPGCARSRWAEPTSGQVQGRARRCGRGQENAQIPDGEGDRNLVTGAIGCCRGCRGAGPSQAKSAGDGCGNCRGFRDQRRTANLRDRIEPAACPIAEGPWRLVDAKTALRRSVDRLEQQVGAVDTRLCCSLVDEVLRMLYVLIGRVREAR